MKCHSCDQFSQTFPTFTTLPPPCVIVKATWKAINGVGLGTKLAELLCSEICWHNVAKSNRWFFHATFLQRFLSQWSILSIQLILYRHLIYTSQSVYTIQAQYVFIHDALDELITCGETDIPAAGLRVKVNHLKKTIPGSGITGFARQFKVQFVLVFLNSVDISVVFEQFSFFVSSVCFVLTCWDLQICFCSFLTKWVGSRMRMTSVMPRSITM